MPRARVAVCGLNPHAGEGGELGTEEKTTVGPAVLASQRKNIDAHGPFSADTLFYHAYRGDYDAVVAMYHDQGLCPLKLIGFETGVNWTLGLPFIRTSPDHGTAYNIAGEGIAEPDGVARHDPFVLQPRGAGVEQPARDPEILRKLGDRPPPVVAQHGQQPLVDLVEAGRLAGHYSPIFSSG